MKKLLRNNVKEQYGDYNYKGLHLCAKSGTAQIDNVDSHNTAWFVGFMDDDEHPYAFGCLLNTVIQAHKQQVQLQTKFCRHL